MRLSWFWLMAWLTLARAWGAEPTAASTLHAEYKVGGWIWGAQAGDKQTVRFWKAVTIPDKPIVDARLRMTVDNAFSAFLDGQELGRGTEWRSLTEFDLTWVLKPGVHVIAVEGFNDYNEAGFVAGLAVEFADGTTLEVPSDATWRIVPTDESGWTRRKQERPEWGSAVKMGDFLTGPWAARPVRIVRPPPVRPIELRFWQTGWFQGAMIGLCGIALYGCVYFMSRLAVQSHAQQILQRERARIARDIHDDFGARLTKLVLFGELARKEIAADSPGRARFDQICTEGRNLLGAVDEVIWAVNSRRDTLRDFETYVCNYTETFLRPTAIRYRMDADPDLPDVPFDLAIRRNLYLAVKEALNNAVKHSGATEVLLEIHLVEGKVMVAVEDNGRGFDPATASSERNGVTNIRQRMTELGGTCHLRSELGKGCRVELTAPLRLPQDPNRRWWRWWR